MFPTALRSTLIGLVASAIAVAAEPSLSLKVSSLPAVDGVHNLKVVTTLTNTGDETLKLLNDPRGSLNSFPANTFTITDSQGSSPAFTGAMVKYVPSASVKSFTVLTPGQSVEVSHDLSSAYNFTTSGAGTYTIEPSNLFTYIDASGSPVNIHASNDAVEVKLSGTLAVSRKHKRASFNSCSSSEMTQVDTAASDAQTYANNADSYLQGISSGTTRYTTWFGSFTSSRYQTVLSHYDNLSGNDFSSFTYDCSCSETDTFAYTFPDQFGEIYLCGAFWRAPATGTDSKAGTIIHESTHFTSNAGTSDYAYGQTNAKSLAQSDPAKAVMNADSHEYFAENNPSQS